MIIRRPESRYDVVIVGAGPAGLAAAVGARENGAHRVLVVDREPEPGGILQQCIHTGFGLHTFDEELTGPEFAERYLTQMLEHDVDLLLDSFIIDGKPDSREVALLGPAYQGKRVEYGSLVLAMGCRERTRGALRIPGTRPAGIYTAGLAQRMVNMMGVLPGRKVVILGSGDIGLIMARRLVLEGCDVQGVFEILPYSSGLNRNIAQCLDDFDIPLHLSTTVTNIGGRERVEWVEVTEVDSRFRPRPDGRRWKIDCDTLLLSVGLIPENELSGRLGVNLDLVTRGPTVDSTLRTSAPGVYACGNVLHVHDLVDYVAEEAFRAGGFAAEAALAKVRPTDSIRLIPGRNVRYCVPQSLGPDREHTVLFRVARPFKRCEIRVVAVAEETEEKVTVKRLPYAYPAEMLRLTLSPNKLQRYHAETLRIDCVERKPRGGGK